MINLIVLSNLLFSRPNSQKELGSQLGDVVEEKEARNKAEKQKKDLNEEVEVEGQVIEGG